VVNAFMADLLSVTLLAVIWGRGVTKATAPQCSPLRGRSIETLPKIGWPTIGMGRGDGSRNKAKSDDRYDHNQSHGSSRSVRRGDE